MIIKYQIRRDMESRIFVNTPNKVKMEIGLCIIEFINLSEGQNGLIVYEKFKWDINFEEQTLLLPPLIIIVNYVEIQTQEVAYLFQ